MSRFEFDDDEGGVPWDMWEQIVSRALGSERGQRALAEFEEALLALPEKKLIEGHLASDEGVCLVGAYVANRRAKAEGLEMAEAIASIATRDDYEDIAETAHAGKQAGLSHAVAWHMAYLNDEQFHEATPEERYEKMLAWVRRAQGKGDNSVLANSVTA